MNYVVSSGDDGTVKLWDLNTGDFIRNLVQLESTGSGGKKICRKILLNIPAVMIDGLPTYRDVTGVRIFLLQYVLQTNELR